MQPVTLRDDDHSTAAAGDLFNVCKPFVTPQASVNPIRLNTLHKCCPSTYTVTTAWLLYTSQLFQQVRTCCHMQPLERIPPLALSHACRGACVDVFAPGVSILSAVAGSDSAAALKTGTSMAGAACVCLP